MNNILQNDADKFYSIVMIDSDQLFLNLSRKIFNEVTKMLQISNIRFFTMTDPEYGIGEIKKYGADIVMSNIAFPYYATYEAGERQIKKIRSAAPSAKIFIVSANNEKEAIHKYKGVTYLSKLEFTTEEVFTEVFKVLKIATSN